MSAHVARAALGGHGWGRRKRKALVSAPREPEALIAEQELELGHTVQCLNCRRVFLVARDQAETGLFRRGLVELPGSRPASARSAAP